MFLTVFCRVVPYLQIVFSGIGSREPIKCSTVGCIPSTVHCFSSRQGSARCAWLVKCFLPGPVCWSLCRVKYFEHRVLDANHTQTIVHYPDSRTNMSCSTPIPPPGAAATNNSNSDYSTFMSTFVVRTVRYIPDWYRRSCMFSCERKGVMCL